MLNKIKNIALGRSEKSENAGYLLDQLRRLQAEFDNYRKRTENEKAEAGAKAQAELIALLLPIHDGFVRAEEHLPAPDTLTPYTDGLRAIGEQFRQILAQAGLEPMNALGEIFDPERHKAVGLAPAQEPESEGHVVEVTEEGYLFKDMILRPASVIVAAAPGLSDDLGL
ncbi:MAG: nucleotide exchange factor GrpE [Candidatus Sumerlaeota bacterium]|nr:nucleotide exchange factor GrpE [Candidatus Sumerlaeota bacterium]